MNQGIGDRHHSTGKLFIFGIIIFSHNQFTPFIHILLFSILIFDIQVQTFVMLKIFIQK